MRAKTKAELRKEVERLDRITDSQVKEIDKLEIQLETLKEVLRGWRPATYPPLAPWHPCDLEFEPWRQHLRADE